MMRRRRHADAGRRPILALLVVIVVLTTQLPAPTVAAPNAQRSISEMPITFPVQSPEAVEYFNRIARPEDIAAVPTPYLNLLPQIQAGRTMVIFRSWAEAEQELDALVGQVDAIAYNPEHWEFTPMDEQESLPATLQRAGDAVRDQGFEFVFVPDRRFAEETLRETAPYADSVILQGQRLQSDPQAFADWMQEMIAVARERNPELQIYVQVGATQGTAGEMLTAVETVAGDIDGIAVWTLPQTFPILQEFVELARTDVTVTATPSPSTATPAFSPTTIPTVTTPTTTPTPVSTTVTPASPMITQTAVPTVTSTVVTPETVVPAPTPTPETTPGATGDGWGQRIVLVILGILIGIVIGILVRRVRAGA